MDLRGAGRDVARKMGLARTLRVHATREEGIRFVDAANRTKAAFASGSFGGQGPITDLEILRADLSRNHGGRILSVIRSPALLLSVLPQ
ncbi:hypothetical protein [Streptomyces sp. NPDC056361]|uniref:hypothetical protein n=1 Tax=Streptomyces sp. NPDC056361 TaxID=3345795 RepID=UPI0035DDCB46